MSNKTSSSPMSKAVKIYPAEVEFDPKDKAHRKVLAIHNWTADKFGHFFPATLTQKQLLDVISKTALKLPNLTLKEESGFLSYHYKGRPILMLNLKEGQFYSPASEVEAYGKEAVQHQAHIVVDMLKHAGLSTAVKGKEVAQANTRQLLSHLKSYNKTP